MNGLDQLKAAQRSAQLAAVSFTKAVDAIAECCAVHEREGVPLPEPFRKFLELLDAPADDDSAAPSPVVIPAPPRPRQPPEAGPDWIWINLQAASPQSVVLAVLRAADTRIRARDLAPRVQAIRPDIPKGSIANVGTKFDGTAIERTEDGWAIRDREQAGILVGDQLWGPTSIFGKYELAAHRRDGILYLLSISPAGLQATQIEEQLRRCSWLKAPVNKDLLKADIEYLAGEGKIRRRGASRKWEIRNE